MTVAAYDRALDCLYEPYPLGDEVFRQHEARDLFRSFFNVGALPMPISPAPDSMVPHADWLIAMLKWPHPISIRDYHVGEDTKAARNSIIEATRHLSTGMRKKVLAYAQETEDNEIVNHYFFSEEAKKFWQNGLDNGHSPTDILNGWEAMQTIMAEVKNDQETTDQS